MSIVETNAHVELLPKKVTAPFAFERLKHLPHCCWLDSALAGDKQSRYSFLAADPIDVLTVDRVVADPLAKLELWLERFQSKTIPGLPPFQGGVAGFMGYELGRCFERVPAARHNEFDLPLATLALYDVVLAWDHRTEDGWIISQGFSNEPSPKASKERAVCRSNLFQKHLAGKEDPSCLRSGARATPPIHHVHAMAHGLTAKPRFKLRGG